MTSPRTANEIKALLVERLTGQSWLRGVCTVRNSSDPTVKVSVSKATNEIRQLVTGIVAGTVNVLVEEVGEISGPRPLD